MDPCFYKRDDALIMRVFAPPDVLTKIHTALYDRFKITTGDGSRFLGMDVLDDHTQGLLNMDENAHLHTIHDGSFHCLRHHVGLCLCVVCCRTRIGPCKRSGTP
jgi:hypothetical protein